MRYDVAIIGAGADGLAAANLLASAGLGTIVLERQPMPGGRLATRQFHPGYFAAPFAAGIAPIPDALFWSLDLARHGALRVPGRAAAALWPDRIVTAGDSPLYAEAERRRTAALVYAQQPEPAPRWQPFGRRTRRAWPAESWTQRSLAELADGDEQTTLLAAAALEGRAADPLSAGSALTLLACHDSGIWRGGLGGLGAALAASARAAGAELSCGLEVSDIRRLKSRAAALTLADGTEIEARAIISTLDLKRTFLSLFAWSELPKSVVKQVGDFRIAGSTARLLVALAAPPAAKDASILRHPLHVMPDIGHSVEAHAAWRAGIVAEHLPLSLRFESAVDPGLAPPGAATMSVSIGCVPHTPFDGVWTHDKRDLLTARALAAIEEVFPGLGASVVATELLVPPDIETALGATAGDPDGGEIAPDQMFAFRPGFERKSPYTPVEGLYLAGPSAAAAPLATCAAGAIAAEAVIADLREGKLP